MAEIKVNNEKTAFFMAGVFKACTNDEVVSIMTLYDDTFIVSCPALTAKQIDEIIEKYALNEVLSED